MQYLRDFERWSAWSNETDSLISVPYNSCFPKNLELKLLSRSLTTQRAGGKFVDGVDYILFTLCFTDDYVFQAML